MTIIHRAVSIGLVLAAMFCVEVPAAGRLSGLELRLSEAREKLDKKPRIEPQQEPESTPYTEFGPLVDEAYQALEEDLKLLLREKVSDRAYQAHMDRFVRSSALAVYLDPSDSVAALAFQLFRSGPPARRKAFEQSVEKLDPGLRSDFRRVMKIQERVAREGNG